jgi:hypothetical protein
VRCPARFVAGQLVWTYEGTVWAIWRVRPQTYPHRPLRDKLALHARTRGALMALGGESMLLGVCERIDPTTVVEAMADGVDLESHPAWAEVCLVTLDNLGTLALYRRAHYVAAALPRPVSQRTMRASLSAAGAKVGRRFGLPPVAIHRSEVLEYHRQADHVGEQLRGFLGRDRVRAAKASEVHWLYARATRRGVDEPSLSEFAEPHLRAAGKGDDAVLRGPSLMSLGDVLLREGGDASDPDRPRHRRYLRAEVEAGVGFQVFAVVSDMPQALTYPDGAECLSRVDEAGFPVDWCVRIRPTANADAQAKIKRQLRQLQGQFDEYKGDGVGAPPTLATAVEAMEQEWAELAANPAEPELETTTIFAVWAPDLPTLEDRADRLRKLYETNEYGLPRPTGGQLALYGAMLPGAPLPSVCRDYSQFLLPATLAACAPFAGTEVGERRGALLAMSLDGVGAPVHWHPGTGPATNRSGSIAIVGKTGSGKTYLLKSLTFFTLGLGGRVLAVDRTAMGEYGDLGTLMPGTHQVVRLGDRSDVCLDPMRVFAGEERIRYAVGFLSLLSGTSPTQPEGAALAEAVRRVAERPGARLGDVVTELLAEGDEDARAVGKKLRIFTRGGLGDVAFGDGPGIRLDADYLVFHLPGLDLPDEETLRNEHLARQLLPEQVFSMALLYLVAAVARHVAFADRRRFSAILMDEAWVLTASPQGRQLLLETVREGRRHNAGLWMASQDPRDILDDRLADLMGSRFVFRLAPGAAQAGLRLVGMDATESAIQLLEEANRAEGQCLYRDIDGDVGLVQILEAPFPELHEAFDTNPDRIRPAPAANEDLDDNELVDEDEEEPEAAVVSANGHRVLERERSPW